jgi:hypothetical protein
VLENGSQSAGLASSSPCTMQIPGPGTGSPLNALSHCLRGPIFWVDSHWPYFRTCKGVMASFEDVVRVTSKAQVTTVPCPVLSHLHTLTLWTVPGRPKFKIELTFKACRRDDSSCPCVWETETARTHCLTCQTAAARSPQRWMTQTTPIAYKRSRYHNSYKFWDGCSLSWQDVDLDTIVN